MLRLFIRCYAELNDFVPERWKQKTFALDLAQPQSLQDILARIGIPAAAVDLALVNSRSVALAHAAQAGDHISLYPVFESFDISSVASIRERPLRRPMFVADVHLGTLAHHLRMLGFDTVYRNRYDEGELIRISQNENRTLLSKDAQLLGDSTLSRMYFVRDKDPRLQLLEVLRRFDLSGVVAPFTRCIECNTVLEHAQKEDVADRLPPKVRESYEEFQLCPRCNRIYWKGSHHERMEQFMNGILRSSP